MLENSQFTWEKRRAEARDGGLFQLFFVKFSFHTLIFCSLLEHKSNILIIGRSAKAFARQR